MSESILEESLSLEWSGKIGASMKHAKGALQSARQAGDLDTIARALVRVAHVHFRLGHYRQARGLAEEALACASKNAPARVDALILLGNCAGETQPLSEAEAFFRRAVDVSREIGYPIGRMRALHGLGQGVYFQRGQFDLALAAEDEAYRIADEQHLADWLRYPLITTAWICQVTRRYVPAAAALDELNRRSASGSPFMGYHDYLAANLARDRGDPEAARSLYTAARSTAEAFGEPGLNIEVRLGMSRNEGFDGNVANAYQWAEDARAYAEEVGYRHLEGRALVERGRANWLSENHAQAENDFRSALDIFTALQTAYDLAYASLLMAALMDHMSSPLASAAWLSAARLISRNDYRFLLEQERVLVFPLLAKYLSDGTELGGMAAALVMHLVRVAPLPLHIKTFGGFKVRQGAREVPDKAWRQRRAGELFRLLLVSPGRSLLRDQIIEALWPGRPSDETHATFRQATSALRRALESDLPSKFPSRYLEVEEGRVTLKLPPGSWVDIEDFDDLIQREEWADALALYDGEPFADDRYADWAAELTERLVRQAIRAMLSVARASLQEGQPAHALEQCRRALALDSWQEEAALLGMRACAELKDRCGAIRLYKELEYRLREDLDTEPEEALTTLYRSLL
jgi:DNA-binding SARP family transcriptional activator